MIKWLKEGYIEAIKWVIDAHKWFFQKTIWTIVFMLPIILAEILSIWIPITLLGWFLGIGSPEPYQQPMIIDN